MRRRSEARILRCTACEVEWNSVTSFEAGGVAFVAETDGLQVAKLYESALVIATMAAVNDCHLQFSPNPR